MLKSIAAVKECDATGDQFYHKREVQKFVCIE
jgi:hypothetical protein